MWALRRASIPLRSQGFSIRTSRACCAKLEIPSSCIEEDKAGVLESPQEAYDRWLYLKRFYHTEHASSKFSVGRCSFSSQAGAKSSGEEDDLEDGFSELETTSGVQANQDSNGADESDDELISGPELSDEDVEEPSQNELELSDIETDPIEKKSSRRAQSELFKAIMAAPGLSIHTALDKWLEEGHDLSRAEISLAMLNLRKRRMYGRALQLSEWLEAKKQLDFVERDYASRLDLISKVRGLQRAESYIEKIPKSFRGEVIYRTLLANCVADNNVKKAEVVFNKMKDLDFPITSFSCNQLLLLYKRLDKKKIADVLLLMEKESVKPTLFTYKILIDTKGQSNDITGMDQIVETMKAEGIEPDINTLAIIARHYASGGLTEKAEAVLKEMEGDNLKDRFACRLLLPLYAQLGKADDVRRVWKICESNPWLEECMAAIEAWGRLKKIEEAEAVFDIMSKPLLKACARSLALEEGMQIHGHVFKLGLEDDVFVQNSLISMYGKFGEVKHSCAVFEQMDQKTVASWSAVIGAHASLGLWCECLMLFGDMSSEENWRAEESTLVSVLSACTHLGALDLGRCTHGSLLRNISGLNVIVQTSLIDMYVKCGCLEKGWRLFQNMAKKNQLSYTVMISGLAMHGHGREALRVFSEMLEEGLVPDDVVYVGVLSACSHAGLVNEGLQCFNTMKFEHGIKPTVRHYGCLVDLMGRAGLLNEAFKLINSMPIEPNDVVWRSLLSACKVHSNLELGEIVAKNIFQLNSRNPSDYLVLSNMYARAQRWEDVARIRTEMVRKGFKQTPGFSLVEVKRKVYKFVSQDTSHPQCDDIYEMIHQMEWQLKFEGYSPDTSHVLLDVDEEEKRQRLKAHSQKLAIAFALIHTSGGSPIRIARNLRMCNDCHTYTKYISIIYERDITVRDRYQFHHFKNGTCSCRDYW